MISSSYDIHKAGGILLKNKGLLVEKSVNRDFFVAPGGKLEGNETAKESLKRELWEEFKIEANEKDMVFFGTFFAIAAGDREKKTVRMDVYLVNKWQGNPKPSREVEEIKWITSTIPKEMKVGSIFEHEVIPRLKSKGLID